MHRTPRTPRTPNPDVNEGELSAQLKSTIIRLRIPLRRSTRLTLPTPIPTAAEVEDMIVQDTIQLSIVEQKSHDDLEAEQNVKKVKDHLAAEEIEKMVEGTENVEEDEFVNYVLNSQNDPYTRLDPKSYKESLEVEKVVIVQLVNVIEEEDKSAEDDYKLRRRVKGNHVEESRNTPSPTTIRSLRIHSILISSDTKKLQQLTVNDPKPSSSIKPSYSLQPKTGSFKRSYMTNHVLHIHPTQASKASTQEQQYQLYLTKKDDLQLQQANLPIWLALKIKFEGLTATNTPCRLFHASNTPCRTSAICLRYHQDNHQDDTYLEGVNSAKRQKRSEHRT
ncbi:hypothetical protein Tco_1262528 [Tanacetum coccineum]